MALFPVLDRAHFEVCSFLGCFLLYLNALKWCNWIRSEKESAELGRLFCFVPLKWAAFKGPEGKRYDSWLLAELQRMLLRVMWYHSFCRPHQQEGHN
jgi:hypothetical protein